VSAWLNKRHGDAVALEFVDLADPEQARLAEPVLAAASRRRWPNPVVTVDDHLLLVPWFSNWTLYDAIEEWLAARRGPAGVATPDPDEMDLRDYGTD
jgi:hypothetical protein